MRITESKLKKIVSEAMSGYQYSPPGKTGRVPKASLQSLKSGLIELIKGELETPQTLEMYGFGEIYDLDWDGNGLEVTFETGPGKYAVFKISVSVVR